ncbi:MULTISPECIES: TetR/AcrR family transcriptional regulator [Pseudomonas]|jgi:DNA-binding transcriptional regulator YbjK|uniref:TetR family transcriptional regulator n=2 Tax=Pseudomonas qingdaonensis TaxID=2056231 RepID=A0ABX8DV00_9PSED|nr:MULTISPECIES: TetR family transcriptional regulator [Pseudomonas]KIU47437.1 TetR family transcriptional regulator [Pseudomonas putida]KTC20941.1 TetR family transcriptional regulator [Pseudomonas putida]MBG8558558.1 TetR family transcriptional regulator [Pseudomonas qingdaonensis]MCO7505359.1 TetR family transcriptional regulator [Pseudomonas sp. VE 267-6A]MCO7528773.1 TetR family transcriptional regulator [Pseudomonas sp. 2]
MAQQGAAGVATAVAESVQYQGRKASRQGSEQRRQQILDAAMRIIVRDGVRGVRHRAVAAEAGVPLSATTYYFKDIEDLLTDTFAQYVERSAAYMAKLWENTEVLLRQLIAKGDGSPGARAQLADEVAKMGAEYVQRQLHNRRDFLMAEQAFRQEALLCPRLAELVRLHAQILLRGTCQLLQVVGSRQPQQDAIVLTAIIEQMEYQGLLDAAQPQAEAQMLAILTRYLHLVLASA